ncbi:nitrile hydratase accessory protein [Tranquillimonas alkanivorans]|uniref:Nitrile hydratase accessory protein n=1 Tax=Tranquillimonas alkanivorans TaxID=441119 RepID=A0A1I5V8Z0_9RHOB|nr:nitrile hydratase accessory protein [Tranquillimonas alkanivorans]SFQ04024.1 nitrile hydratase accessory protein [Tranquillimonas alkanivorans]
MNEPDTPFEEPWQAHLFALTVALNEAGHFTWSEWTALFGRRKRTVDETYWAVWSDALLEMLERKRLCGASDVAALAARWQAAARATPHGQPIALDAAPAGDA